MSSALSLPFPEDLRRLLMEDQRKVPEWQIKMDRQKQASLEMVLISSKEIQARSVLNWQARLISCQTQLANAQSRFQSPPQPGVDWLATSCTQFSSFTICCTYQETLKKTWGKVVQ